MAGIKIRPGIWKTPQQGAAAENAHRQHGEQEASDQVRRSPEICRIPRPRPGRFARPLRLRLVLASSLATSLNR